MTENYVPIAATDPILSIEGESVWREFKTSVEWSDNFELIFLFSDYTSLVELFRKRLLTSVHLHENIMVNYSPEEPNEIKKNLLSSLLPDYSTGTSIDEISWVDLTSFLSQASLRYIKDFLTRLNERREKLRSRYQLPFIIALPESMLESISEIAPDIWSIRSETLTVNAEIHTFNYYEPALFAPSGDNKSSTLKVENENSNVVLYSYNNSNKIERWKKLCDEGKYLDALSHLHIILLKNNFKLDVILSRDVNNWLKTLSKIKNLAIEHQIKLYQVLALIADSTGNKEKALKAFQKSLRIKIQQIKNITVSVSDHQQLAMCYELIAKSHSDHGDSIAAYENYERALASKRKVAEVSDETEEILNDIATLYLNCGDMMADLGSSDENRFIQALRLYESSLSHLRVKMFENKPKVKTLKTTSDALVKIADMKTWLMKKDVLLAFETIEFYREAISIKRKLFIDKSEDISQLLSDICKTDIKITETLSFIQNKRQPTQHE